MKEKKVLLVLLVSLVFMFFVSATSTINSAEIRNSTIVYSNSTTLEGWCNASSGSSSNLSFGYEWFKNNISIKKQNSEYFDLEPVYFNKTKYSGYPINYFYYDSPLVFRYDYFINRSYKINYINFSFSEMGLSLNSSYGVINEHNITIPLNYIDSNTLKIELIVTSDAGVLFPEFDIWYYNSTTINSIYQYVPIGTILWNNLSYIDYNYNNTYDTNKSSYYSLTYNGGDNSGNNWDLFYDNGSRIYDVSLYVSYSYETNKSYNVDTLTYSNFSKYDNYTFSCNANDFMGNYSNWLNSSTITIIPSIPSFKSGYPYISSNNGYYKNSTFTGYCNATGTGTITTNYTWFVNGLNVSKSQTLTTGFKQKDNLTLNCLITDSEESNTANTTITINNSIPFNNGSIQLDLNSNLLNVLSDEWDYDFPNDNLTLYYYWYVNGVLNSTNITYSNATTNNYTINNIVYYNTNSLIAGSNVYAKLQITDGFDNSSIYTTANYTKGGTTAPTISNIVIPATAYTTDSKELFADCVGLDSLKANYPKISFIKPDGTNTGNLTMSSYVDNTYRLVYIFSSAGTYSNFTVSCQDINNNLAVNTSASTTISSVYVAPVTPAGGGGGGTSVTQYVVNESIKIFPFSSYDSWHVVFGDELNKQTFTFDTVEFSSNRKIANCIVSGEGDICKKLTDSSVEFSKDIQFQNKLYYSYEGKFLIETDTGEIKTVNYNLRVLNLFGRYIPLKMSGTAGNKYIFANDQQGNKIGLRVWWLGILVLIPLIIFITIRKTNKRVSPLENRLRSVIFRK